MLTIRLQRAGKKNKPDYRLILAEKTAASQKKFTEVLGSYNPHTKTLLIRNQERLNYWVDEQHVELSATARNLLISKEIIKGTKTKAFTIPKKEVVAEETPAAPAEATPATEETLAEVPASAEESKAEETPTEVPAPEAPAEETSVPDETPEATPTEVPTETPAEEPVQE
jgi:small subunit ribosomal protein S16